VTTDYSQNGILRVSGNNVSCCYCTVAVLLDLTNYSSVDFDLKWDNSSTVPLAYFNFGGLTQGLIIGTPLADSGGVISICYSNLTIPDAATNGWVHVSAQIDSSLTGVTFAGITLQKAYPAYNSGVAAFWLDNVKLVGRASWRVISPVSWSAGNFTLRWNAVIGATYSVLRSADLMNWTTLVSGYPTGGATNSTLVFTDTGASGSRAFYRVSQP
jgi:hypothetical protein